MKDASGARQQSSFKGRNFRQPSFRRILYKDMTLSYDFSRTAISREEQNRIIQQNTPNYFMQFSKMIEKNSTSKKFCLTQTLPNGNQFIVVCFND